jgi:hypothetical protein
MSGSRAAGESIAAAALAKTVCASAAATPPNFSTAVEDALNSLNSSVDALVPVANPPSALSFCSSGSGGKTSAAGGQAVDVIEPNEYRATAAKGADGGQEIAVPLYGMLRASASCVCVVRQRAMAKGPHALCRVVRP